MSYLTKAELLSRFDEAEIDEVTSQLDAAAKEQKISDALTDAEALVNSYLSRRYSIPFSEVRLVKPMVANIARFLLYDNAASSEVRERYEDSVSHLKDIANGKADLVGATGDADIEIAGESQGATLGKTMNADLNLECF